MSLFAIGDTHLSFGVDKPMGVFDGWKDYEKKLEEQWNAVVREDDTVVLCGDISWGMDYGEAREDFAFLNRLKGQKIILRGNHDYWWTTKTNVDAFLANNGFDSIKILFNNSFVIDGRAIIGTRGWLDMSGEEHDEKILSREVGRLRLSYESLSVNKYDELLCFLHYPPIYLHWKCEPIIELMHEIGVQSCYYGHIHGEGTAFAVNREVDKLRYKLVSADALDFCPFKVF